MGWDLRWMGPQRSFVRPDWRAAVISWRPRMRPYPLRATVYLASALLTLCCLLGAPVHAQPVPAPPAKVEQLLGLLDDPEVKTWLAGQKAGKSKPEGDEAAVADQISTV